MKRILITLIDGRKFELSCDNGRCSLRFRDDGSHSFVCDTLDRFGFEVESFDIDDNECRIDFRTRLSLPAVNSQVRSALAACMCPFFESRFLEGM